MQKYLEATGDLDQIRARLFEVMTLTLQALAKGETAQVVLMENGLLWVGDEDSQLTWMDARVDGKPVTPRHGMAVEINALWYNALSFHVALCEQLGEAVDESVRELPDRCGKGFVETFWRDDLDYHLAYIPAAFGDAQAQRSGLQYMNNLYLFGFEQAKAGYPWRLAPPGIDPQLPVPAGEQAAR